MSMGLRTWQDQCKNTALAQYLETPHFFCQATPGAGKTRMAAELAKALLDQGRIDLVLCFAPSRQVVEGFRRTFSDAVETTRWADWRRRRCVHLPRDGIPG